MEWIEKKKREIGRLTTTFHFSEAVESLARDILLQHERNHHLYLQGAAPLPVILRVISLWEAEVSSGRYLETIWVLGSLEDPDGLFLGMKNRISDKIRPRIQQVSNQESLYKWAYICFQRGWLEPLARLFFDGRLDENDYRVQLLKARLAIAVSEFDVALEVLDPLMENFPEAVLHRAGLYWRLGMISEANADFSRLLSEKYVPAMKDAVKFYLSIREAGRALEAADLLPGLKRGEPESRMLRGAARIIGGQVQAGVEELVETQNEIWVRAFPVKYDTTFRVTQDFLRKGLFAAGVQAGKNDALGELVAHPSFSPDELPEYVSKALQNTTEAQVVTDLHYISKWLAGGKPKEVLGGLRDALIARNDPRGQAMAWQLKLQAYGKPKPLPASVPHPEAIHQGWFGCETAELLYAFGMPYAAEIRPADNWEPSHPGLWNLTIRELTLTCEEPQSELARQIFERQLPRIEKLTLKGIRLDAPTAYALVRNIGFSHLKSLSIEGGEISYAALQTILTSDSCGLTALSLKDFRIQKPIRSLPEVGDWFLAHAHLQQVQSLILENCHLTTAAVAPLGNVPFQQLTTLSLANNELGKLSGVTFADASWWNDLVTADFSFTGVEEAFLLLALEKAPNLAHFSGLSEFDFESMEQIEAHPRFSKIDTIDL